MDKKIKMEEIIQHYLPIISQLEIATGKSIKKQLERVNDKINFISKISEIKFGGLLLNEFNGFLTYEPKILKKTPDWLVKTDTEKIIFEVLKINLPNKEMEKKISDFENKISSTPYGTLMSNGISNDYGKILTKEETYRELIENQLYKFIICVDVSEFQKYIDIKDIEFFFSFNDPKSEIYKYPKFIDNVSGIIVKSYWVNDYRLIINENVKNKISKPIMEQIKKATLNGLKI